MISKLSKRDKDLERAVELIYDKLNELIDAVNQPVKKEGNPDERERIRIVNVEGNTYKVEIKTDKGWMESTNASATGFKLKEE